MGSSTPASVHFVGSCSVSLLFDISYSLTGKVLNERRKRQLQLLILRFFVQERKNLSGVSFQCGVSKVQGHFKRFWEIASDDYILDTSRSFVHNPLAADNRSVLYVRSCLRFPWLVRISWILGLANVVQLASRKHWRIPFGISSLKQFVMSRANSANIQWKSPGRQKGPEEG